MFQDLHEKYNWVLDVRSYPSVDRLLYNFKSYILDPALEMDKQIIRKKSEQLKIVELD